MYPRAGAVFSEGSNDRATEYRPDADHHQHPHGGGGPPAHRHDNFYYAAGSRHHFRRDAAHIRMFVLFKLSSSGMCFRGRTSMTFRKNFGILLVTPSPCLHLGLIHSTQPPLLHLHLGTPTVPYPHQMQTSF